MSNRILIGGHSVSIGVTISIQISVALIFSSAELRKTVLYLTRSTLWIFLGIPSLAFAWGERGHQTIARVAARAVAATEKDHPEFYEAFLKKELYLAHCANIPDIAWRSMDAATRDKNAPTHFVDADLLVHEPTYDNFPETAEKARALAQQKNIDFEKELGTAPWRIEQFFRLMVAELSTLKKSGNAEPTADDIAAGNRALMYAGLMAHFVGDLAQPLHTTKNYDGWDNGQGGIHRYFEEDVVNVFPLSYEYEVLAAAKKEGPMRRMLLRLPEKERALAKDVPLLLIKALIVDSYGHLHELFKLDRSVAMLGQSLTVPLKKPANRKDPSKVAERFQPLITDRLALASDVLAHLWVLAWEKAGKPRIPVSLDRELIPAFVVPDYLASDVK